MIPISKRLLKSIRAFAFDQYLVLFFMLALGIKLYIFNTYITKTTWSSQYIDGIICGYLSAALVFSPLFFVRRYKNKLAIILAFLFSFLLLVDTVYYSYFNALPTIGLLSSLGQTKDVGPAIWDLLSWKYILFFIDVILVVSFGKQIKRSVLRLREKYNVKKSKMKTSWGALIIILTAFWISLLPTGLNNLSDVFNRGYDTVSTSQYYGVLMAQGIDVARFIKQETTSLSASEEKSLVDWVKDNKPKRTTNSLTGIAKGKNVIMIQIESLGGFVINQKINNKEITPNLNKLAKNSRFFPNDRFLIAAGHTSDTDFVSNSSYFPLPDAATFVRYGQDNFSSLPKTLISNGYSAYAYHGFNRNFWNRNVALNSLGYQKFYAADNYPKDWKINMGLNDGTFLDKTADYIKKQPKPNLSYVITLSTHVPFSTNDQMKDLGVKISDYPDQVGGYLENINYTDRMLGKFFDKLKLEGLYDDSLILVYGDHTPVLPAFKAGTVSYDPETVQEKEVPLIVKLPNETLGITYKNQGTHLDIMPTILDLLGINNSPLMFGQSLFTSGDNAMKICSDQLPAFPSKGNCNDMLAEENNMSSTIIRFNQFNNLQNK